jgi:hypothetical protein
MDTKAQGAALLEKLKAYQTASNSGTRLPDRRDKAQYGSEASEFPARYVTPDDRDDYMAIKNALATDTRPAPVTDEDIAAVLRKRAQFEVGKQEDWFQNTWKFDSSNPTQQRWAQTVFPEYFGRREQVIDEQTLLQNQLAKIKLRGPRTREDIDLLYAIQMGVVEIPEGPIFDLGRSANNAADNRQGARGVFSPRRIDIGRMQAWTSVGPNPLGGFPNFSNGVGRTDWQNAMPGADKDGLKELAGFGRP